MSLLHESDGAFTDDMTLGEARSTLRELVDDGAICPCCTQFAKVYKRKLNSGMARSLIAMYRAGGTDWIHLPSQMSARSREEGKLRYWGLVQEMAAVRDDGGHAGYWRVTSDGAAFVSLRKLVPKYAHIYDGRCLRLTGGPLSIRACLGDRFDYAELMGR